MITGNYQPLPKTIIGNLHTLYVTNFPGYANTRIDVSQTGNLYLVLPLSKPDNNYEILVEISYERLKILKGRGMSLIHPFKEPEKGFFFLCRYDSENRMEELYYIQAGEQEFEWPFYDTISIDFSFTEKPLPFNLFEYAVKRNRIAISIRFETTALSDNMKIWSIKNFLIPFTDLIKTVLTSNNQKINSRNVEQKLNLGFSKIKHKCLDGILEFDYSPNLLGNDTESELENLQNLYFIFGCESQEEIISYFNNFRNKKIIPQYINLLRAIIHNDVKVISAFATPVEETGEIRLTRIRAKKVKKIMEAHLQSESYEETVVGVLTRLDFEQRKAPMFALHASHSGEKYCGTIAGNLVPEMNDKAFNFRNMEYNCTIEVRYTPESPVSKEKYDYTLLKISEVSNPEESF